MTLAGNAKIRYSVCVRDLFKPLGQKRELVLDLARDSAGLAYVQLWLRPYGGGRVIGKQHSWPLPVLEQGVPEDFAQISRDLGLTPEKLMNFIRGKAKDGHFKLG